MLGSGESSYGLIHVTNVSILGFESANVTFYFARVHVAVPSDNIVKGDVDVLGHAFRVTTDVEVPSAVQPLDKLPAVLPDAVLHIDLVLLVSAEGGIKSCQQSTCLVTLQFVGIQEICRGMLVTKEQPVRPFDATRGAFV